jgi:hypothetical protein
VTAATKFTGGTDDHAAYEKVASVAPKGGFDTMIHFTDGELPGNEWPRVPARRFVIGLCGKGSLDPDASMYRKPPPGTRVVPIAEGEDA